MSVLRETVTASTMSTMSDQAKLVIISVILAGFPTSSTISAQLLDEVEPVFVPVFVAEGQFEHAADENPDSLNVPAAQTPTLVPLPVYPASAKQSKRATEPGEGTPVFLY